MIRHPPHPASPQPENAGQKAGARHRPRHACFLLSQVEQKLGVYLPPAHQREEGLTRGVLRCTHGTKLSPAEELPPLQPSLEADERAEAVGLRAKKGGGERWEGSKPPEEPAHGEGDKGEDGLLG